MKTIQIDCREGRNLDEWNDISSTFRDLPAGLWECVFRKPSRTPPQNRRYWKRIIVAFSETTGYTLQETHQILAKKFLSYEKKGKSGNVQLFIKSTTELSTREFCEYCDSCELFGSEYGIKFNNKDDNQDNEQYCGFREKD